jgi:hypothetical protein
MKWVALRTSICCLMITAACAFLWPAIRAAEDPRAQEVATRKAYADDVRKTYSFRFGEKISLPGNAAIEGNDFIEPDAFYDAAYCGHCIRTRSAHRSIRPACRS